jgi:tripeptide aminopeptidase
MASFASAHQLNMTPQDSVLDRFLRYVQIDTQSDPNSQTFPSTEKQKNLGRMLEAELRALGVVDAHMDVHGYVYATLPSNTTKSDVPVICFCSHMDTAPDVSGYGVKPLVHHKYAGQDLVLPDDPSQVLRLSEHPDLSRQIGNDLVTASGTTLLGADNKAGVAEIMSAVAFLQQHPNVKHGVIKILFTPDEEVGRGTEKLDLEKLGADFAYTVDGESLGTLENETFSADGVRIEVLGVSTHPGFAFGKMENALKIASEIVAALPKDRLSPETTQGREGFLHPVHLEAQQERAVIEFIVRDFTEKGLREKEEFLQRLVAGVVGEYPGSAYTFIVKEQYRNMGDVLELHPQVVANAMKAMTLVGLEPVKQSIRGGTDGSRLSFMGLPCPNIFAGEHAFHSKLEWVSVQDMEKAVEVIVKICEVWEAEA